MLFKTFVSEYEFDYKYDFLAFALVIFTARYSAYKYMGIFFLFPFRRTLPKKLVELIFCNSRGKEEDGYEI